MNDTVTIAGRFIGPPRSANGGYACGITARACTHGTAQTSLRVPPPVERPMRVELSEDSATLYDGDTLVAHASPATVDVDLPTPVTPVEAKDAAESFDHDAYRAMHYFPTCFTCGPDRADGDGLRLFPGKVDRPEPMIAWPWTPDPSLPREDGGLDPLILWAALDCPSGWATYYSRDPHPHVLGSLATRIERLPEPGEPTITAGWPISDDGRKERSASAIWSADGELLAVGAATWIALTEEQFAQFRVAVS